MMLSTYKKTDYSEYDLLNIKSDGINTLVVRLARSNDPSDDFWAKHYIVLIYNTNGLYSKILIPIDSFPIGIRVLDELPKGNYERVTEPLTLSFMSDI